MSEQPKWTPGPAYWSFDATGDGVNFHETLEEAQFAADRAMDSACDPDGGFPDDEDVAYGVVLGRLGKHDDKPWALESLPDANLLVAAQGLYDALARVMLNHRTPCQCGDAGLCHVCLATAALAKARGEVQP